MPDAPWYKEGLSFTCSMCGNCCSGPSGTVRFVDAEVDDMAKALNMSRIDFLDKYTDRRYGFLSLKEIRLADGTFDCVFLKALPGGKRGCEIYMARPTQCRTWPFWHSNLQSEAAWEYAAESCPGMQQGGLKGAGKHISLNVIQQKVAENDFRL